MSPFSCPDRAGDSWPTSHQRPSPLLLAAATQSFAFADLRSTYAVTNGAYSRPPRPKVAQGYRRCFHDVTSRHQCRGLRGRGVAREQKLGAHFERQRHDPNVGARFGLPPRARCRVRFRPERIPNLMEALASSSEETGVAVLGRWGTLPRGARRQHFGEGHEQNCSRIALGNARFDRLDLGPMQRGPNQGVRRQQEEVHDGMRCREMDQVRLRLVASGFSESSVDCCQCDSQLASP